MKSKDLAFLLIRLICIYFFILFIMHLSNIILVFNNYDSNTISNYMYILPYTIILFLSIILWIKADYVSNFLIKDNNNIFDENNKINKDDMQVILFSFAGLIIISSTFPQLIGLILNRISLTNQYMNEKYISELTISIIQYSIKLFIGVYLFIGSKGIVKIFKKIYYNNLREEK